MIDPLKHFDAPRPPTALGAALALQARRWPVVVALVGVAAIVGLAAVSLLFVDALAASALAASVAATTVFATVDPQASAAEAEALGPRIAALPAVAGATLRTKDDALRTLVAAGLPPPDGRNPLPDVWIVRIRPGTLATGAQTLSGLAAETQQRIGALPHVASTRSDARWITAVDAGAARWADAAPTWHAAGFGLLGALLAGVGFLGGGALRQPDGGATALRVSVLTLVATAVALAALAMTVLVALLLAGRWNAAGPSMLQDAWVRLSAQGVVPLVAAAAGGWLVLVVAMCIGGRSRQ